MVYYLKGKIKTIIFFTCHAAVFVKNKNKTVIYPPKQSFSEIIYNHVIQCRETQRGIIQKYRMENSDFLSG